MTIAGVPNSSAERLNVSIIIPTNHQHTELYELILSVCAQSVAPTEIIIIDSSDDRGECPADIKEACTQAGISLWYQAEEEAFPGHARNLGIERASCQLVGFVDVKTIPCAEWLRNAQILLVDQNLSGLWGLTTFEAVNGFTELLRDGFFGRNPRRTLPGSVFRKEILIKTGCFLDWVRAGEDTDWIQRVEISKLKFGTPLVTTLTYKGLTDLNLATLAKKWARNYAASSALPHLFPHKIAIWVCFYAALILVSFNWNNLVANWNSQAPLYIPNITKITIATPSLIYLLARTILIPYRRGVPLEKILPIRWLAIAVVCIIGDLTKAAMLLKPTRRNQI